MPRHWTPSPGGTGPYSHENVEAFRDTLSGQGHTGALHPRPRVWKGRRLAVVYLNGLDSCKELLFWSRLPQELARRGISTLSVDQPGTGENPAPPRPARHLEVRGVGHAPSMEWLAAREDVDAERIGVTGISLGGFYAPRVCAFEPQFLPPVPCGVPITTGPRCSSGG